MTHAPSRHGFAGAVDEYNHLIRLLPRRFCGQYSRFLDSIVFRLRKAPRHYKKGFLGRPKFTARTDFLPPLTVIHCTIRVNVQEVRK